MMTNRRQAREQLIEGLGVSERRILAAGVDTSVLASSGGPPLLLLHGLNPAGGAVWWPVLGSLAERFSLLVPDLPGMGESEPAARLDFDTLVPWLADLLRTSDLASAPVVGTSLGGGIVLRLALRHPELVDHLTLVDSCGLGHFRPPPTYLLATWANALHPSTSNFDRLARQVFHSVDAVAQRHGERWLAFRSYALDIAQTKEGRRALRAAGRPGNVARVSTSDLRQLKPPVALIWGAQDGIFPTKHALGAKSALGATLDVIPDAGHIPYVEQPDRFIAALTGHQSEVTGG